MIGAFARMLRSRDRVLSYEDTPEGHRVNGDAGQTPDAPPVAFVAKHSEEGGDVYVAPVLDALRAALRRRRGPRAEDAPTPSAAPTLPRMSDSP